MPHIPDSWLDAVTVGDIVGALLALGLIGGVVLAAIKLSPVLARVTRVLDLILGRPYEQGIPAQPSMTDRLDGLEQKVDTAIKELTPNHGSSAHDKLARGLAQLDAKVDGLYAHLGIEPPDIDDQSVAGTE